jgi:hypothetical protein
MILASHIAHMADSLPASWRGRAGEVVDYIEAEDKDGKVLGSGSRKDKEFLLLYHLVKETLLMTRDEDGKLAGVVTWHRVKKPWTIGQLERWRPDDEDGKDIILVHMLARDSDARRCLLSAMSRRIDDAAECSFHALRGDKVKTYAPRHINRFFNN